MKSFLFTLGAGMAAGALVTLMLPQQSGVRKTMQKAADKMETAVCNME
ncbi:MAG: hypothetical protein MJ085_05595 [Clostridia bacterium]|nr:hypothetical protein [Clostridia bacterium]